MQSGVLNGTFVVGQNYLSESVAGGVTQTPPSSPNYVVPLYDAISTTQALVKIQLTLEGA